MARKKIIISINVICCLLFFLYALAVCAQEEAYVYKHVGKKDPFVPLISSAGYLLNFEPEDQTSFLLEGILYDADGGSIAIINGELVKVGEGVGSAVLTRIEPNKITLIQDNEKVEIELRREE